ncbi:3-isopropylmalate dehydratase large subunit [Burkholderia metallica]|uniref:3-isopropylmalate dehydratase large subunit n=1 Tax=Burkholderia metallica TaxID=488729 RepID=UPI00157AF959|nr:3-isopropylmalate dehydratase large subunit [Burkholderia metallica]NTZ89077.1 3-isopropylmalate dehydratase large subunit [Burkholderia metallica]
MSDKATLFDKLWRRHEVVKLADDNALLYIDRHLLNEVTSPQAFSGLRAANRKLWRAGSAVATADHNIPTRYRERGMHDRAAEQQLQALYRNCDEFSVRLYDLDDPRQGILHVVAPERGQTLPGTTIVCGDSHTTTHGAFSALAFGIGTSDIEHVLATQTLVIRRPRTMRLDLVGTLPHDVSVKDVALAFIGRFGADCATGHALEFSGEAVAAMSMEERMTLCNMSVEAGARCSLIGVDQTTLDYLANCPESPQGARWSKAVAYWKTLRSDPDARFDRVIELDISTLRPQVTWGTSPAMVVAVDSRVPDPMEEANPDRRRAAVRALEYMGLAAGTRIDAIQLDKIFIGSCTNARIEDLRGAAKVLRGRIVAPAIKQALVVPGSTQVKRQAESEGLDRVFTAAGFEWRDSGCSMCLGMNNDSLDSGERCASTSNRNFEGRQGRGGRSHLVSPVMAAAAAVAGHFIDPADL